jgi:hypothetical protein
LFCRVARSRYFAGADHRASVPTVDATVRAPTRNTKVVAKRS